MNIPRYIIVHHTVSGRDTTEIEDIDSWHKARNFPLSSLGHYTGYHYVIFGSGLVIHTRRDSETGYHCGASNMNTQSIGVCLTGNFEEEQPSTAQLEALKSILDQNCAGYGISRDRVLGHQEVKYSATACPGKNLLVWVRNYRLCSEDIEPLRKEIDRLRNIIIDLTAKIAEILKSRR